MYHLHCHSMYSMGDGLQSPEQWAKAYKEKGFKGAALTDHGTMAGMLPFYYAMKKEGLKPILGMEAYFNENPLEKTNENRKNMHLVLLAKNYNGLQNLFRMSERSYKENYYYRARIGWKELEEFGEDIICLSACVGGPLAVAARRDNENKSPFMADLNTMYNRFHDLFRDDFYVEIQGHDLDIQRETNKEIYDNLIMNRGAKVIVTNDCHYIDPKDAKVQDVLKMAAMGNKEKADSHTECHSLWLKSRGEIEESFKEFHPDIPEDIVQLGLDNTHEVFMKCKCVLPEGQNYLPKFRDHIDSKDLFKKITTNGLAKYLKSSIEKEKHAEYIERFKYEYGVISKYGLEDYFLIVWDLIRFAQKKNIWVGLGRGSAAGCLISYLMGIVRIDPIKFDLIFERFLNKFRIEEGEMPDIDLDFESDYRQDIKNYIIKTYGKDYTCDIGTYGRMKLKTSLIDFAKAMGVASHREILNLTTKIETDDFEEALEQSPKLKELALANLDWVEVVESVVGQIKTQAVHPAGIIVSPIPVRELTPLKTQKAKKEVLQALGVDRIVTTQNEDKYIIAQGLMKVDVLGVKQYDIIKASIEDSDCEFTRDNYVELIDYEDKKVWKYFQKGRSDGVFQFASDGMKGLLKMMKPDCIEDLIAANALYRPGPLNNNFHIAYANRKLGKEEVEKVHPIYDKITEKTYGLIVYQEQVMSLVNEFGKIPMAESDIVRSALGKKKMDVLEKYHGKFVDGAASYIGREKASKLWDSLIEFSKYSFNKSHSAAYAVLAYISQRQKIYHKEHFWANVCEWDARKNKVDDLVDHFQVAGSDGVKFELPHVNKSKAKFYVDEDMKVISSFMIIKGLGVKASLEIESKQPFKDFSDFVSRVNKSKVKVDVIMNMIAAGCFDSMGERKELMAEIYSTRTEAQLEKLTSLSKINYRLKFYEVTGFFEKKLKFLPEYDFDSDISTEDELVRLGDGDEVLVGGMISEIMSRKTRKGDNMAFGKIIDNDEKIQLTVFASVWDSNRSKFKVGNVVQLVGQKTSYGGSDSQIQVLGIEVMGEI